jgi:L-ascorbate metabolism protein UlaG (beta-lactamase superfamily)
MPYASRRLAELALLLCCSAWLQADVTITQLANEGVILSDGRSRVMIDGMVVEPYSIYGGLPVEVIPRFNAGSGEFADIGLALVSHRHHDHNQPAAACSFLQASEDTSLRTSEQVIGLIREKCRDFITTSPRVMTIDPQYEAPYRMTFGDVSVTIFPLSHGTRKYAKIQNYGHLVEIGGLRVLHIGDAAMDPTDFERAGLHDVELDVALIPFWFFQPGPGAAVIERFLDAPLKLAVHIPPGEMAEVTEYMAESYPRVQILEQPLEQIRFSEFLSGQEAPAR